MIIDGSEPCPLCGANDLTCNVDRDKAWWMWQVVCNDCGYGAELWYKSAQLAADYWNHNAKIGRESKVSRSTDDEWKRHIKVREYPGLYGDD